MAGEFNIGDFLKSSEFQEAVAGIASQHTNAKIKQFKKETLEEVNKSFETFAGKLAPQFDEIKTQLATKKTAKSARQPNGAGGGETDDEQIQQQAPQAFPELRTMQKKIEELELKNRKTEEARQAEQQKNRSMLVRSRLRDALEQNGVNDPVKLRAASAILISEDRRVDYSESLEDAGWKDTDGEFLDLEQGVRSWLQSDEGQHYVAPVGAGGSGSRPRNGKRVQEAPQPVTATDIGGALFNVLGKGT